MENIIDVMIKKDTFVIVLILFYDSKLKNPIKVYMVLSFILYSLINNYVCIGYLCYQYKTLNRIHSARIFKQTSYNILLCIGIT